MLPLVPDNSEYQAFAKFVAAKSASHRLVVKGFIAKSEAARRRAGRLIERSDDVLSRIERLRGTHEAACRRRR